MTREGTIPLPELEWVKIYFNNKKYRSTKTNLQKMLGTVGGDVMINGAFFLRNLNPCCHLKADGVVKCTPAYGVYGISWNTAADFGVKVLPNGDRNYMENTNLIVGGVKQSLANCPADVVYSAPRTAVGMKAGQMAYYASRTRMTPTQLQEYLSKKGWSDAIMLDGGGSTCYMAKDGDGFVGDGRVIPFFLMWKYKADEPQKEPDSGEEDSMNSVNVYSKKGEGLVKLSANFRVSEFACNDGSDPVFVSPKLVDLLQKIRDHFGAAVVINSGYRTPTYNTKVGGVYNSQHLYGTAADIVVRGKTPTQVGAYAREIMPDYGGVGIYTKKGFTHVDVREKKSDWVG